MTKKGPDWSLDTLSDTVTLPPEGTQPLRNQASICYSACSFKKDSLLFPLLCLLYLRFHPLPFHSLPVNFTTSMVTSQSCYNLLPLSELCGTFESKPIPVFPAMLSFILAEIYFPCLASDILSS